MTRSTIVALILFGCCACILGQQFNQRPNSDPYCKCVEIYQCPKNGTLISHDLYKTGIRNSTNQPCESETLVCCGLPKKGGCGFRNMTNTEPKKNPGLAAENEFPWMIYISTVEQRNEGETFKRYKCGGSLIHRRVVLTAAHCIDKLTAADLEVRAGEWDATDTNERHPFVLSKVSEIKRHPNFNNALKRYNFALLILSEPFEFAPNINTICLPEIGEEFDSTKCIFTGWGKLSDDSKLLYSPVLKAIELPTVAMVECENRLIKAGTVGPNFALHDSLMCAGGIPGYDSCYGDGGSPLVCPMKSQPERYVQAGIVTWGRTCNTDIPAIYAKVSEGRQWIDGVLKNLIQTI